MRKECSGLTNPEEADRGGTKRTLMFQSVLFRLRQAVLARLRWSWFGFFVMIAVLTYGVIFSWITIQRNYGFATFAWDLGIFNQAFYTTVFNGKLLYYTCELYLNPSGSYFASKFSPILLSILPFYAIWPTLNTLLVLKSFVLALGAVPLYFVSKNVIRSKKAAFVLAISYLLSPGLQSSNIFDFQQQIFIPVTIFCLYYFLMKKRWKPYFLCLALALMIEEHVAVIIFLLSLFQLLTVDRIKRVVGSLRKLLPPRLDSFSLTMVATMIISTSWYLVARLVREAFPIVPQFIEVYQAKDAFQVLGFNGDILSLPVYIFMNPQRTLEAFLYDYHLKFLYLIFLFAPLIFLSLRSKLALAIGVLLVPFFLSNYRPYYMLGAHYPLYILPLVYLAAIESMAPRASISQNFLRKQNSIVGTSVRDLASTLVSILVVSLIIIISVSPLSPVSQAFMKPVPLLMYPAPYASDNNIKILHDMINMVPSGASILCQNNIFPHFSTRINAYVIPTIQVKSESAKESLRNYIRQEINQSDYVLLDSVGLGTEPWTRFALDEAVKDEHLGIYAIGGSGILFKRGSNDSAVFVPSATSESFRGCSDFIIASGQIAEDDTSNSKKVAFSPKETGSGIFIYGPYVFLPHGAFNITFEIKVGDHEEGYLGKIDVSEEYGTSILCEKDLYGFELSSNKWINSTLVLTSTRLRCAVEFRVFTEGVADIYLDRVVITRISSDAESAFGTRSYGSQDLVSVSGEWNQNGFLVWEPNTTGAFLWYGPYITIPPGSYRVAFFLRTWSSSLESGKRLLSIDVTAQLGQVRLANQEVYSVNPDNNTSMPWRQFILEFTSDKQQDKLEFRGFNASSDASIYLSFVLLEKVG